jgi:hypothetical protein
LQALASSGKKSGADVNRIFSRGCVDVNCAHDGFIVSKIVRFRRSPNCVYFVPVANGTPRHGLKSKQ